MPSWRIPGSVFVESLLILEFAQLLRYLRENKQTSNKHKDEDEDDEEDEEEEEENGAKRALFTNDL